MNTSNISRIILHTVIVLYFRNAANTAYHAGVNNQENNPDNLRAMANTSSKHQLLILKLALCMHVAKSAIEATESDQSPNFPHEISVDSLKSAIQIFKSSEQTWLLYRTVGGIFSNSLPFENPFKFSS